MARSFFPDRWWKWFSAFLLLALIGAPFWPPHVSMGPTFGPGSVAQSLLQTRLRTGRWPRTGEPIEVGRRFRDRAFVYALWGARPERAIYRIDAEGRDEVWRVALSARPRRLARL